MKDKGAVALLLLVGFVMAFLAVSFSSEVPAYGKNIGSFHLQDDWLVAGGWAVIISLGIVALPRAWDERRVLLVLWGIKSLFCLFLSLWYESHYEILDAFTYFNSTAGEWGDWSFGIGRGTDNIYVLCWLHQQIFPGYYHVMKVSFAAIGLLGIWIFYLSIKNAVPRVPALAYLTVVGLIPSVAFWSSIIGKDPLALLAVGLYAYGTCTWSRSEKASGWWAIIVGMALAAMIRVWLIPVLSAPLLYLILRSVADIKMRFLYTLMAALLFFAGAMLMVDRFEVFSAEDAVAQANDISRSWATGGSAQRVEDFQSLGGLGAALPWWMFTFLFRPFPGEIDNAFGLLTGIENIAFLLGILWGFWRLGTKGWNDPLLKWGGGLVLAYSALFSVAGYQNLGTAVRWRLPIEPFMVAFIAYAYSSYRLKIGMDRNRGMENSEIGA